MGVRELFEGYVKKWTTYIVAAAVLFTIVIYVAHYFNLLTVFPPRMCCLRPSVWLRSSLRASCSKRSSRARKHQRTLRQRLVAHSSGQPRSLRRSRNKLKRPLVS